MELVIFCPEGRPLRGYENSLLRRDENGIYYQITDQDELSNAMKSLSLKDASEHSNVFRGAIVQAEDFEKLHSAALIYTKYLPENMVLKINNNAFIWFSAFNDMAFDETWKKIENEHSYDHQMLLYRADEPIFVSSELNVEKTDPSETMVHVFYIDKDKKSNFKGLRDFEFFELQYKTTDYTYNILIENNSPSADFDFDQAFNFIKNMKKKYVTVLIKEGPVDETTSTSDISPEDLLNHYAYTAAFGTELIGNVRDDKVRLLAAIHDVNKNVSNYNLYIPTISICQGSGSGKTKLSCSLDSDLPCAYIVFREEGETAYPEKSKLGDLFLNCFLPLAQNSFKCEKLSDTNIGVYVRLIYAIASDYLERVMKLRSEYNIVDKISLEQSKKIRQKILQECVEGKFFGTELTKLNDLSIEKSREILTDIDYDISAKIEKIGIEISNNLGLPLKSAPLVITLDEVYLLNGDTKKKSVNSSNEESINSTSGKSKTVTRLRLLRRAMHALGNDSGVVFLTLGTKSDYADLNPKVGTDSMRNDERTELYPPFILSSNTDLFYSEIAEIPISANMLKDPRMILVRYAMGRPLWGSLAISEVVRMAIKKLKNSSMESGEALVACWMLRTGIAASPHMIDTSRHLVKSNMATLLGIHPSSTLMNVCYPSEPVLAIAAQDIVNDNLIAYFEKLRHHLMCKGFDRGDLAETLAAEICLQAVYKAELDKSLLPDSEIVCKDLDSLEFCKSRKFVLEGQVDSNILEEKIKELNIKACSVQSVAMNNMKLITLESFLRTLYGKYYDRLELDKSISPRMLKGIVDFNHFIRLNEGFPLRDFFNNQEISVIKDKKLPLIGKNDPNSKRRFFCRAFNQLGLKRGAAFFLPDEYPGIDLMIPICLEDSGENGNGNICGSTGCASEKETVCPKKKTTLAMLTIQAHAGSLNSKDKNACAEKMFLDNKFYKCTKSNDCPGCNDCLETQENYKFMMENQLGLVFTFGPSNRPVEKRSFTGNGRDEPNSSKLTVIFNNGQDYLRGLWGNNFEEISGIVNEIIAFSWLPHNFIDPNSRTGPYHRNQLLQTYLDKPLFPEFSDIFRAELGWEKIKNPNSDEKNYQNIIKKMRNNYKKTNF